MLYLAYHPKTRPTGRRLADALGIVHRGTLRKKGAKVATPDFLIRWGNGRDPESDTGRSLNPAKAIWTAGDKLASFQKLAQAEVRIPEFTTTAPDSDGVWLARKRRGFGGRDIQVYEGAAIPGTEFYSRYVPNDREYRVHVVGDKIVRVQRKYLERPAQRRSEYIKNHQNGYVFKTPSKRLNKDRLDAAVKAVQALGLDFGAVDLVVGHDNLCYVLEVNTAPACAPKTLQAYAVALADLIRTRSNEDYILHPAVSVEEVLADVE